MRYVATDFAADAGQDRVADALRELDEQRGCAGNRLYYLAVPPTRSRRSSTSSASGGARTAGSA